MTKRALKVGQNKLQQTITEKRESRRAKENVTPVKLKKKRFTKSSARKSIRNGDSQKAYLLKRINEMRNINILSKSSKKKNIKKSNNNSFDNSLSTNNSNDPSLK